MNTPHRPTKAERTGSALLAAARKAETMKQWDNAAEFYEAAAAVLSGMDDTELLRKASMCRIQTGFGAEVHHA